MLAAAADQQPIRVGIIGLDASHAAVMLESNVRRVHLEQVAPVLAAGKRMVASLADVLTIFQLAGHFDTPVFSTSCLRSGTGTQAVRRGVIGAVQGCDVHSPDAIEPIRPDFYRYGIHYCEALFTGMGTGCATVTRTSVPPGDVLVGVWKGGRIGTFRALRADKQAYGGIAFSVNQMMAVAKKPGITHSWSRS